MRYPPLIGDVSKWAERLIRQLNRDYEAWGGLRWEYISLSAKTINTGGAASSEPDRDAKNHDLLFDSGSTEEISAGILLPLGYKIGRPVIPCIYYEPTDANSGVVVWVLRMGWRDVGTSFDYSTSFVVTTLTSTLNAGSNKLQKVCFPTLCSTSTLSISGVGSMLEMRLSRLGGADTYGADIRLKYIGAECQTDRRGSRTPDIKD